MVDEVYGSKSSGSGESHTPVEDPDSLQSTAYARVLDLVSEGPIVGLVNGQQSVFLNETPLINADGSANFSGVSVDQRIGTQDQPYMQGFPSVENETAVGVEFTLGKPWSLGVNNLTLSAIRLRLSFPALFEQKDNGDVVGTSVRYRVELSTDGGSFQTVLEESVVGKTTGGYEQSRRISLPRATSGWVIRVSRMTPDSTSSKLSNKTSVASYTEVIDAKFRYPNSAYIGVSVDASQFGSGSIPSRAFHLKGRVIRVPSNYEPETRIYSGVWDGTFKTAYSNNPAWVFFDICTHPRYGLGHLISAAQVDRYTLYQIGRYCDELVSDGRGGQEPRFTCNAFFQSRVEAVKMLQDLASIFRGISYWAGSSIIVSADMPVDPVYTFNNSNVIGGKFIRGGSSKKSRASVALVSWNDPDDFYRVKVEYVEDSDTLKLFGYQPIEMTVIGCTSQGQAQRAGRWALLTNKLETGSISFEIGLEGGGKYIRPGAVIKIADARFSGKRIGGRLRAATYNSITVDGEVILGVGDKVTVILPTGIAQERIVGASLGSNRYQVTQNFDSVPVPESPWVFETAELMTELYRIVSISERDGDNELGYKISAVTYAVGKHDAVDSGTRIDTRPVTIIPPSVQKPPANVRISESQVIEQGLSVNSMDITWDKADNASYYEVQWRRDSLQWVQAGQTTQQSITVQGIYTGNYEARVRAYNALGVASTWSVTGVVPIKGKQGKPPTLSFLRCTAEIFAIHVEWGFPAEAGDTAYTELQYSSNNTGEGVNPLSLLSYPTNNYRMDGLAAGRVFYFRGRLIDRAGNVGDWTDWVRGTSSADPELILEYLKGKITESELGQDLLDEIDKIPGLEEQIKNIKNTLEYDPEKINLVGDIVRKDNKLWQAIKDVPAAPDGSNAPPNDQYWTNVGDLLQTATTLAVRLTTVEIELDAVKSSVSTTEKLLAQFQPEYTGDEDIYTGDEDTYAGTVTYQSVFANAQAAQAMRTIQLESSVGKNYAAFLEDSQAKTTALNAVAIRTTALEAKVGEGLDELRAQVQTTSKAVSDLNGKASASQVVQVGITANNIRYAAGWALGIDYSGGQLSSQFVVLANRFAVLNGTDQATASLPFIIENGQTFINDAFIRQATITNLLVNAYIKSQATNAQGQPLLEFNFAAGTWANRSQVGNARREEGPTSSIWYDGNGRMRLRIAL